MSTIDLDVIPVMKPWLGPEEARPPPPRSRPAGSRRALACRLRGGLARGRRGARRRGLVVHHRAAPRPRGRSTSVPATRWSCRRCRSSRPPTSSAMSGRRRCSPTSTRDAEPHPRDDRGRAITPATRAVIVVHQAGVPADIDAIHALCDRAASPSSKTPRAPSAPPTAVARSASLEPRRVLVPSPQGDHHRRGRHGHDLADGTGRRACVDCASTG